MNENHRRFGHSRARATALGACSLVVILTVVGSLGWPASGLAVPSPSGSLGPVIGGPTSAHAASAALAPPTPTHGSPHRLGPITPDVKVPALTVYPTSGPVGTQVQFNATQYADGSLFSIVWTNGTKTGATICSGRTTSTGAFTCTFKIPAVHDGAHEFTGTDAAGHPVTVGFTVVPALVATPASGLVGTPVEFVGSGYDSNTTVTVSGPEGTACSGATNFAGAFDCSFSVPPSPARANDYVGAESTGPRATAVFEVVPGLTAGPSYVMAGSPVTFTGTGFGASVTVSVQSSLGAACSAPSSGTGGFSCVYTVPASTPGGSYVFNATDTASDSAVTTVVITFLDATPSSGPVGTSVNFTAGGFTPSSSFTLSWAAGTIDAGTTSATGTFGFVFTVPATTARGHLFTATDGSGLSATRVVTVVPALSVAPAGGPPLTPLTFAGTGFNASSSVKITWGSTTACTATTAANGSFGCSYSVPSGTAGGVYTFTATDSSSNTAIATFVVTYVGVSPASGPVGTSVTVSGGGYSPSSKVTVTWEGVVACAIFTSTTGAFSCPAYKIPYTTAGSHPFTATDTSGNSATVIFAVTPQLTVTTNPATNPAKGAVNSTVTFTGTGFNGSSALTVVSSLGTACSAVTTGATGGFNCTYVIPPTRGGTYTFTAQDASADRASATFTVVAALAESPTFGVVSTLVRLNATGFANSSLLHLTYGGGTACSGMTSPVGGFVCTFRIPPATGTITFTATDASSDQASATFTINSNLTATPSSGTINTIVTFTGTGFGYPGTGLYVTVTWLKGIACTAFTNSIGNFTCSFAIPAGTVGSRTPYTFTAAANGSKSATAGFEVGPELAVTPGSGPYNSTIEFLGAGYTAFSLVSVTWNGGVTACSATTGMYGTFNCSYRVGVATVGSHTFTATDGAGLSASTTFLVTSELSVTPTSGTAGTPVAFVGHGFAVGSLVNVTWSGGPACSGTANATGSFTCVFTIPATTAGPHTFRAAEGSNSATAVFTVTPSVAVSPGSGAVGTPATFSGMGFAPSAVVSVTWSGGAACTGTSTASGSFSCGFKIPDTTVGAHTFTATDPSSDSATTTFLVGTVLTAGPSSGPVLTDVVFSGTGYSGPGSSVTVSWTRGTACTGTTSAAGSFNCTFQVPAGTGGGPYVFTGTDSEHVSANTTFSVTPVLLAKPAVGAPGTAVTFDGSGYADLSTATVTWSGGTVCASTATNATGSFTCTFTIPSGTVGGVYTFTGTDAASHSATALFTVTFLSASPSTATVGSSVTLTAGGYASNSNFTISWNEGTLCSGKTNASGGFVCSLALPAATAGPHTLTGTDAGSHTATTTLTISSAVVAAPKSGPVSTPITFTGTGYAGGEVVTVSWAAGFACGGTATSVGNFTCSYTIGPAPAGAHSFTAADTSHDSVTVGFTVLSQLTDSPTTGFPGSSVRFSGTGYAASSTVSVSWSAGAACSGPTSAAGSFNCSYTIPSGTAQAPYTFNGTDGLGDSATVGFTVYGLPSVTTPTPSSPGADVGEVVNFTTTASGGSGTYSTYSWTESAVGLGCTLANAATISCTPTGTGTFTVTVTVTDSRGATSAPASLANFGVTTSLTLSTPGANRTSVDVGQAVTFSVSASGGAPGYTYSWTGLPNGCASTAASFSCSPRLPDPDAPIVVTVTDTNDATVRSATLTYVVYSDPSVGTPTASATSVDVGQVVTFTSVPAGGSGLYTFLWSGLPSGCATTNASVTCSPTANLTAGSISVTVTDSNGWRTASPASLSFTVFADPTVGTPVGNRTSADKNQSASFSVTATGPAGGLTYAWAGLPAGCAAGGASVSCAQLTTATNYSLFVTVRDANGFQVSSAMLNFRVFPDPTLSAPSASSASADIGQSPTFSVTLKGGSGGAAFVWSHLPAPCAGTTATVACVDLTTAATYDVSVSFTDSNGYTATAPTSLSFVVHTDPTVETPSETHSSVDIDQSVTFSTSASGGSGGYTYVWSGLPCGGGNTATVTCSPTAKFTGTVRVTVTDSNGFSNASASGTPFAVYALPTVVAQASASSILQGKTGSFTATVTGGLAPYRYFWIGLPAGCGNNTTSSVSCTFSSTGTFRVTLVVVDTNLAFALSNVTVTVQPSFLGLPAVEGYAVVGGAVAAVVLVGVLLAVLVARRRRQSSSPVEWSPTAGSPPGPTDPGAAPSPAPLEWAPPEPGAPPATPDWSAPPEEPSPWAPPASPWEPPPPGTEGGSADAPRSPVSPEEADWNPPSERGDASSAPEPEELDRGSAQADPRVGEEEDLAPPFDRTPSAYPPEQGARASDGGDGEEAGASEAPGTGGVDRRPVYRSPAPDEPEPEYAPPRSPHRFLTRAGGHSPATNGSGRPRHRAPPGSYQNGNGR